MAKVKLNKTGKTLLWISIIIAAFGFGILIMESWKICLGVFLCIWAFAVNSRAWNEIYFEEKDF